MDLESVKRYLETGGYEEDKNASTIEKMPLRFFERFIMQGLHIDLIEPGRVVCSMKVPPRLLVITTNPKSLCFYVVFWFKYIIKDLKMTHLGSWDNHHRWILYAHAWFRQELGKWKSNNYPVPFFCFSCVLTIGMVELLSF